jgi:hypothetical protein
MSMNREEVLQVADDLRSYAEHFEFRDWNYTRDLGKLESIRYSYPEQKLLGRVKKSLYWLFHRAQSWEKQLKVRRVSMAFYALHRDTNLPDGVLDGGSVITFWEETGEYLQMVQPTVGSLIGKWLQAEPESEHARLVAAEMKRIQDGYTDRINKKKKVGTP